MAGSPVHPSGEAATSAADPSRQMQAWLLIGGLSLVVLLAYANAIAEIAPMWNTPLYSHAWLIPIFAAVLLWLRREPFDQVVMARDRWIGVGLIALAIAMRLAGAYMTRFTVDRVSMIPCLLGVFVLVGGLRTMRWAGPPILFLVFMYPLPRFLEEGVLHRLQNYATAGSNFALQTLGLDSYRQGTNIIITLADRVVPLNVEEACSGLRMLTVFIALAVAMAMLTTWRPWWERLIVIASAVPIAVGVNIFRITVTGLMYTAGVSDEFAQVFFHDFAGWFMMPLALGILYLELVVLSALVVERPASEGIRGQFAGAQPVFKPKGN